MMTHTLNEILTHSTIFLLGLYILQLWFSSHGEVIYM